jgi:hypothetical protein
MDKRLSSLFTNYRATDSERTARRRANLLAEKNSKMTLFSFASTIAFVMQMTVLSVPMVRTASDLMLAPKLSFDDDSSPNFPIQGQNLSEGSIASGEATVVFFGTSNCWNTAREAERLVQLYPRFRDRIRFVIVDLNHVGPEQEGLVSRYYHGYIPTIAAIDSKGNVIYDRAGGTASTRGDTSNLQRLLDSIH